MKRFFLTCGLCAAMLAAGIFLLMPAGLAKVFSPAPEKENVLEALLNLPAPPPPNPLEQARSRDESFYDPKNPPPDNAPIEDLVDYWTRQSMNYRGDMYYRARPSERVVERLISEAQRAPDAISAFLNVLPDDRRTGDLVMGLYDRPDDAAGTRDQLKRWLTFNSDHFVGDLERVSARTHDSGGYVNVENENNVLALTRWDWERARPIVDRMYGDTSQPVTRVLATWALYKHALLENDIGEIDRYRNELMRTVENRSLSAGIRDKANDAITHEADFPERDDWAFSLFEDETWVSLPQYTGLTTLILKSPPDKYTARLIDLTASKNKVVRAAAVRCLLTLIDRAHSPDIIRALLPWLEDPKWVDRPPDDSSRMQIVSNLVTVKMPESVPGLIAALDEKATRVVGDEPVDVNANAAANVVRMATNSARNANANVKTRDETYYPLRDYAIRALTTQADPRAVPALRRLLATTRDYGIAEVMRALQACGGFSAAEQVDALEEFVRRADLTNVHAVAGVIATANTSANAYYPPRPYMLMSNMYADGRADAFDTKVILGMMVASNPDPSDVLARAAVDRIETLDTKDVQLARGMRQIVVAWRGLAVSALLLRDLKNGHADSNAIVRLLSERKLLREKLSQEVGEIHNGSAVASGISACLAEEPEVYDTILDGKINETKTAFLACARLIRAPITLAKVEPHLRSSDPLLKSAAELYLESEDSPQARAIVLAQHPGEAKILGAAAYFTGRSGSPAFTNEVISLFSSVVGVSTAPPYAYGPGATDSLSENEKRLQKEVKEDPVLVGVYSYQENFVRIYKDKVVYSWDDDPSRYHERNLKPEEFAHLKEFLTANHVDELKPFLSCFQGCGTTRELLMLGRNGGSRVFLRSDHTPDFFVGLEKIFGDLRAEPAAIKYTLSKEVPGLELLFASDQFDAETVWKRGSDIRVVVSNAEVRAKVDEEVSQMEEAESDDAPDEEADSPANAPEMIAPSERVRIRRQYEGYSWQQVENGQAAGAVLQPSGVEYIPPRDSLEVQPGQEQWKARSAAFEIRADSTGLYKVAAGKMTKLKAGNYTNPVVSANGRWLVANKFQDDEGEQTIRYNLVTNREYKIQFEGYGNLVPRCFIPSVNKFLVIAGYFEDGYYEPDDDEGSSDGDPGVSRFQILDPETGAVTPAPGEIRPLSQQTFRALQPTGKLNESWAALSSRGRNETVVGTYDARLFRFKPILKLPKISFDSMDMWVDETEGKVYFVYSGHLLSIPLKHPASTGLPPRRAE